MANPAVRVSGPRQHAHSDRVTAHWLSTSAHFSEARLGIPTETLDASPPTTKRPIAVRVSGTNRRFFHYFIRLGTNAPTGTVVRIEVFGPFERNLWCLSSIREKATAMDFVFDMLANHALSGLQQDIIEREQYMFFHRGIVDRICHMAFWFLYREDPWNLRTSSRLFALYSVAADFRPCFVDGGEIIFAGTERIRTWADYACIFRDFLVGQNLVAMDDSATFLKIVMFIKRLRSELSAPATLVNRRRGLLAWRFIDFILSDAAPVAAGAVGHADQQVAAGAVGHADDADEPVALDEDTDADEPVADGVVDEPVADGVVDEPVALDEDTDADEPVADGVVDEPVADGVLVDEPVAVDEDGDVVMETEEVVSDSRGSKRRRSQALSYEREMSRVTAAKRRYNLRDTRAREERMANLKEAEDSKRKADVAESLSEGSRKRSRR